MKNGLSGIFAFSFRIYSSEKLKTLYKANRDFRYQIYEPTVRELNASMLETPIPFKDWPEFQWSPLVPENFRKDPPEGMNLSLYEGEVIKYDGMRVNIWGEKATVEISKFYGRFLNHLRHLSGQPWINSYEKQISTSYHHQFKIDAQGRALESPIGMLRFVSPDRSILKLVDNDMWKEAFDLSVSEKDLPSYWNLYYDALNNTSDQNITEIVLFLTLSLEVAKNFNFQRFVEIKKTSELGIIIFEDPFNDTDLIKHLSFNVEKKIHRNLKEEQPEVFNCIQQLYSARHHIAHGKKAVYKINGKIKPVTMEIVSTWISPVYNALRWIESL